MDNTGNIITQKTYHRLSKPLRATPTTGLMQAPSRISQKHINLLLEEDKDVIEIDLTNCGLVNEDIVELVDILSEYPKKRITLNLYCNNIGNTGAMTLSTLNNVCSLNLCYNNVKDAGLLALIANPSFNYLDFHSCAITDACVDMILSTFKGRYINVHNNSLSSDNIKKIEALCLPIGPNISK